MEFKDQFGYDLKPGDKVTYWSPTYNQWRPATVVQFLWNSKGWSIKVQPGSGGVILKGDWSDKVRKIH